MSREGKKYEVAEIDGRKVEIKISGKAENGPFFAYVEGKRYQGPDVELLKEEILKEVIANYEKEPVIALTLGENVKGELFGLKIERFYAGDHPIKGRQFFMFSPKDKSFLYDDDLLGECGVKSHGPSTWSRDTLRIIPYTTERWSALQRLKKQYREMKDRVEELLSGDQVEAIIDMGSMKLLEAPEENVTEVKSECQG